MARDVPLNQLTDHYIQLEILTKLARSNEVIRFTDLKDPAIENSLFMYHANKLLQRGMIEKSDHGFTLTVKGADWFNFVGEGSLLPQRSPRLLVQLFITDGDKILLSRRKGSMKNLLNEYMLPGGIYKYGVTLQENCSRIAAAHRCEDKVGTLTTVAEMIDTRDGSIYHAIAYIFEIESSDITIPTDEHYEYVWLKKSDISNDNTRFARSRFLPELLTRQQKGLQPNELFRF